MPTPDPRPPLLGFGVFPAAGLFIGLVAGIAAGEPSLGAVLGLGVGGLAALALGLRRR